jgi:hypothetical protein
MLQSRSFTIAFSSFFFILYYFFFLDFGKGIMMGSDLGQDHHAQGGSGAFSRIRRVEGGVSVADFANCVVPV